MSSEEKNISTTQEDIQAEISELQTEEMNTKKIQAYAVITFAFLIGVLLVFYVLTKRNKEPEIIEEKTIGTNINKKEFNFKEEAQSFKAMMEQKVSEPTTEEVTEEIQPTITENPFAPTVSSATIEPVVYKSSGSLMVQNTSNSSTSNSGADTPVDFTDPNYDYTFDENGNIIRVEKGFKEKSILETGYDIGVFSPKVAKDLEFDPNLLLSKGTYIGCSLDTRLVSTIGGGISCTVSENVYSTNGKVLLIEKGSRITGFYQSGQLNDGMDRIFVVWQEIRTPKNIVIPVVSGASDALGAAGMQGYVDHHWLQRFGASILLSVIDDAFNVLANGRRSHNNIDYTENSRDNIKEMSNTALEKFINIQPTLYKNQGDLVGVYVNRDIDFSKVYKLSIKSSIIK